MSDANFIPEYNKPKKLTPFKFFMLQNFPYITEDFDSLTTYELMCKLAEYLNKIIINVNETDENVNNIYNAYNDLQNYINNYFNNLDIQSEVNKKLDEMVEDGTLSALLDDKIIQKLNITDIYENQEEIYLGSFCSERITKPNYIRFYLTKDCKSFSPLASIPLEIGKNDSDSIYALTSDILIFNNKFYLLSGHDAGKGTVDIYISDDLKNWQKNSYDLLPTLETNSENWAPKWAQINDELYITLSIRINNIMTPFYAKINSLEPFEFNTAIQLNLPSSIENANQIDQKIIYYNNYIYLFQRRYNSEYDKIELYRGVDLQNLTLLKTLFEDFPKIEAPYPVKTDNGFFIYVDATGFGSGTFFATSLDLENWSTLQPVNSSLVLRHGGVVRINNEINKKLLLQETSYNTYLNYLYSSNRYIDLKYCINNKIFKPINVDNITYYVDLNTQLEIDQIDTSEIDRINNFRIIIWGETGRLDAKLLIKYGEGIITPNNLPEFEFNCDNTLKSPIVFYNTGRKNFIFTLNNLKINKIKNIIPTWEVEGTKEHELYEKIDNLVHISFSFQPNTQIEASQQFKLLSGLPIPTAFQYFSGYNSDGDSAVRFYLNANGDLGIWYSKNPIKVGQQIVCNFSYFSQN